jgi:glycine hydroxymethyltransferase
MTSLRRLALAGQQELQADDPELWDILRQEYERQQETLALVASSSVASPSVLACASSPATNVTAEGYPGARFHAGCRWIDPLESLAIQRAKDAFGAEFANVQPHSATTANEILMSCFLKPGDTLLGMDLNAGGHLTHGSKASVSGQFFHSIGYGLNEAGRIDMEQVRRLALEHRPKLLICGTTAYPRELDFAAFRAIADEVGAYLLADITHIAGLVLAGLHPSPIDHAHFTTTCTHKQLYGPRGGLILLGQDAHTEAKDGRGTLARRVQKGVFPFFQGAPMMSAIAAKARALAFVQTPEFRERATRIVELSRALAAALLDEGFDVISGGSDNHIVLANVWNSHSVTGFVAEKALEQCGLVINKNRVPGDERSAQVTSGVRLGTNSAALRGLGVEEMKRCARWMNRILNKVEMTTPRQFTLEEEFVKVVQAEVREMCLSFPIPGYGFEAS